MTELEGVVKSYIDMESTIKEHITALETVRDSMGNKNNNDSVSQMFEDKVKQLESERDMKSLYKEHGKYREFRLKVWVCMILS